jgi:hypothetical protein
MLPRDERTKRRALTPGAKATPELWGLTSWVWSGGEGRSAKTGRESGDVLPNKAASDQELSPADQGSWIQEDGGVIAM